MKTKYDLVGVDGNAFAVMGYTARALSREGLSGLVSQMRKEAQGERSRREERGEVST